MDLYTERENAHQAGRALLNRAIIEGRELTAAERAQFAEHESIVDGIDQRLAALAETDARNAATDATFARIASRGVTAPTEGRFLPTYREWRALDSADSPVPVAYAKSFFDRLRAASVVLSAGPVVLNVEGASLKVPVLTASATVATYAENATITASDPTTDWVTLDPAGFKALVALSRESAEDSSGALLRLVEQDLIRTLAEKIDAQFLYGTGSNEDLTGIFNFANTTAGAATGATGSALSYEVIADTLAAYEATNARIEDAAIFMAPRTWSDVRAIVDLQDRPVFVDATQANDRTKRLFSVPVYTSSAIPVNVSKSTSNDTSKIAVVDMSRLVVGVARKPEIAYSAEAGFSADQVLCRVTARYDIASTHPSSVVITDGVRPVV